jgi:putative membrane protein
VATSPHAAPEPRRPPSYSRFIFRAPSVPLSLAVVVVLTLLSTVLVWWTGQGARWFLELWLGVFLGPSLIAAALTPGFARALGGRIGIQRSILLVATTAAVNLFLLAGWRPLIYLDGAIGVGIPLALILLFLQGPTFWFRHMSLFGISCPSHTRSIGPSLLQPILAIAAILWLSGPTWTLIEASIAYLVAAFLCCALLLRASDRPLRREFGVSGVSLIRPLLDHINLRDPAATESLERFFSKFAKPANLAMSVVSFGRGGRPYASLVLPTVHPGPFAALGASDLPRKLAERLEPAAGTVLVPHTPCNHDLDLPSQKEVDRLSSAAEEVLRGLAPVSSGPVSPLVSPHDGSFARAQLFGDTVLVVVTQAPAPTDDIDFSVADAIVRSVSESEKLRVVVVDAHNSYIEDEGDITYGTPAAERLRKDAHAAVRAAVAAARPGPLEVGVAVRSGYSIGRQGIGPAGIRALVVRAAGATTAYALIDGNNLVIGHRAAILAALQGVVDAAEVLTTDNHVVHEVDGSINPLGERFPADQLAADVRAAVADAVRDLAPSDLAAGSVDVPGVPVLGPNWTARLLTSLGDTVSMFGHAFVMTFLLLIATSAVVLVALR